MQEKAKQVAELLKLLSSETRLLVVCSLIDGGKTVSQLCEQVPHITMGALSQHLAVLKAAGVLRSEKNGLYVTYFIADPRIQGLIAYLHTHYCAEL